MMLELTDVSCGYGKEPVFRGISFSAARGETVCLLGPNGVGKTTLFKTILGLLPLMAGRIALAGENIAAWDAARRAQSIAYVPQAHTPPFPFTAEEVVLMGRTVHIGSLGVPGRRDRETARAAMAALGVEHLRARPYTQISGGERQLILLARALAQQPQLLCMDEPTASLDFGNQIRVMNEIRSLHRSGITVIMTTHAPSQAFYCADRTAVMGRDGTFRIGPTNEVVTEETLHSIYGVAAKIIGYGDAPESRTCVPLPPEGADARADGLQTNA